ncbi:hypothetical protein [Alkalinema sp. FACHB-956]|uniref:hypothetical protein n=1 Tax=Alkalinema sp. FACHB-956 TaxID=2692768 RepID=UPI0016880A20|nr:hypothetical protein [Alkalinema sp. FACHB-956]MBD2327353.1 hypothetical protein [Alkalinema sp. FACHB-956]
MPFDFVEVVGAGVEVVSELPELLEPIPEPQPTMIKPMQPANKRLAILKELDLGVLGVIEPEVIWAEFNLRT